MTDFHITIISVSMELINVTSLVIYIALYRYDGDVDC